MFKRSGLFDPKSLKQDRRVWIRGARDKKMIFIDRLVAVSLRYE